jgi:hypothetical protein
MLKNIEQLLRKPIPQRRIKGYEPDKRTEGKQRHFEGNKDEKIRGAFGHKKKKTPAASKKTTKRNGGAAAAKKVDDQRKQSASRSKKRK